MDKYTKGILTVIAVGIIGLNVQWMNGGGFMTKAHAIGDVQKVAICNSSGNRCAYVTRNQALEVEAR
jgi:hypothetical protein